MNYGFQDHQSTVDGFKTFHHEGLWIAEYPPLVRLEFFEKMPLRFGEPPLSPQLGGP
ncbi:hypothetical protein SBV1_1220006 [Verrucomicrobia bacterium]|nr:hypothetical protein SBV1_1220006 [Verrucomicrobiota bacterium]